MRGTAPPARPRPAQRGGAVFGLVILLVVFLFALVLYWARAPLLGAVGEWWVVHDELEKAQAIVVLGGDSPRGERVELAAKLYRAGWAPRVVLSGGELRSYLHETELMQREALALGVPKDKLLRVPHPASSTLEEALLLRPFLAEHRIRQVIVVTSNFHARRTRRIFHAVLRSQGTQVWVAAVEDRRFDPDRWWKDREQRAQLFLEWVKSFYTWWELRRLPPAGCLLLPLQVL